MTVYTKGNHEKLCEKLARVSSLNDSRGKKLEELEASLTREKEMHSTAAEGLAELKESERARLNDLETKTTQCYPISDDVATQTDFIVPAVIQNTSYFNHK